MPMCMNGMNYAYSAMEPRSYLKVIKTNKVAKVRFVAVDIVDFSPECGQGVINLSVDINWLLTRASFTYSHNSHVTGASRP